MKTEELEERYIHKLVSAKRTREAAQYKVEKTFSKKEAERLIGTAQDFVDRLELLVESLK